MAKARRIHGLAIRPPAIKIQDDTTLSDTPSLGLTPLPTLSILHPRQAIVDLTKRSTTTIPPPESMHFRALLPSYRHTDNAITLSFASPLRKNATNATVFNPSAACHHWFCKKLINDTSRREHVFYHISDKTNVSRLTISATNSTKWCWSHCDTIDLRGFSFHYVIRGIKLSPKTVSVMILGWMGNLTDGDTTTSKVQQKYGNCMQYDDIMWIKMTAKKTGQKKNKNYGTAALIQ